ncbi:unnamed protein product [Pylaiella littoralis]
MCPHHARGRPRASKRGAGGLLARDPGNSLDGEQDKRHGSIFPRARCVVQGPRSIVRGPSGNFREPARGIEVHRNDVQRRPPCPWLSRSDVDCARTTGSGRA